MNIFKKKKSPPVETFLGVRKAKPPKVHKHQVLVPLLTFAVLGVASCFLFLLYGGTTVEGSDVRRVQVYVDGQQRTLPTRAATVGDLLNRIGINLDSRDIVEPGVNSPIREDDLHINIYRAKPVTVIDADGTKVSTKIAETTPENLAEKAGFKLYPEDRATVAAPDQAVSDGVVGELITIDRSVPLNLNLYGKEAPVRTQADTVGGLLVEKGIKLGEKDKVIPGAQTPIKKDMKVLVLRNGKQIINIEEAIAPPVEIRYDATLEFGTTKVVDPGKPGKKIITYEVVFKKDKEVSRKVIQAVVVSTPKKRIEIQGTKSINVSGNKAQLMAAAGISSSDYGAVDYIISNESGWDVGSLNGSGCAGLGQACPGSKLKNACPNWAQDPVCQLRFFTSYANSAHGGWQGAYRFKQIQGWW